MFEYTLPGEELGEVLDPQEVGGALLPTSQVGNLGLVLNREKLQPVVHVEGTGSPSAYIATLASLELSRMVLVTSSFRVSGGPELMVRPPLASPSTTVSVPTAALGQGEAEPEPQMCAA